MGTSDENKIFFANCNSKLKQFFVDEIATTGTKHMHIFIYSKSPIRFSTLKNRFPVAHIDKANGSVTENRDYLRKEDKWQGSDKEQTNQIDTFEEVGFLVLFNYLTYKFFHRFF